LAIVGSCHFSALNVAESISGGLKASLPTVDKPGVGIIAVEGEILSSAWAVKTLRRFEEDKNVMAVVLRLDTPGGAVAPCQEIVATLRSMTKPVVVSMGSVAASGGVYLAAAGDHILANPGTLTGSIGVIMESIQVAGAMEKLGVKTFTFKSGQFKDILSPFRDMRDEEKELLQNMVLEVYEQFVAEVVKGRPNMTESQIRSIADGRIFTGQEAVRIGLIDEIGGLEEAIRKAVVLATGAYEEEPAILYDDGRGGFLQRLLSSAQTALNPSAILPKSGLKFLWRPGL
jgi:protease-4